MSLSSKDIALFLLSVAVMLFFSRGIGEFLRKFKQPIVIGEIIAGIILGPTIFGLIFPDLFHQLFEGSQSVTVALQGITVLAVVMLLLVSGIEVDLTLAMRQGKAASLISFMGLIFPFVVGFVFAWYFPDLLGISDHNNHLAFALFIGTALSITALPVVARTLMDLNIIRTKIGLVIIASAMFNDLIGWLIFSIILAMIGDQSNMMGFGPTLLLITGFLLFTLLIGRRIINYFIPKLEKITSFPGGILNFILVLGFLAAAFTEWIGVHAIFGAFIIGIAIGDSVYLKEETREIIHQFVTNIFAPLFFVSIGLHVNFIQNFDLQLILLFVVLAFAGKVVGCGLGAYWGGMNIEDSLTIGFGMNSRGAMEIVLGTLAFQVGLIQEKVFVAIVIMALVTSISSAPLMSFFLKRSKKKLNFIDLLRQENIFYAESNTKEEVIRELCKFCAVNNRMNFDKVFDSVMLREKQLSTGFVNSFAIPHARLNIQYPLIYLAIKKEGINFDSFDGKESKVIFLLLTPESEPELQLKLVAEISKKFASAQTAEMICKVNSNEEIISILKKNY